MLKFTMRPEIVTAGVRGSAEGALEPPRKVYVIVISDVRHYFPT